MKTQSVLDRQSIIVLLLLGAAAILVPVLNVAVDPGSPIHLSDHLVPLLGKYISFALLALSVDLIWGFCGILSLGHGAFFALGGYAMGMYLMRQVGPRGVYADPILPDFMVFLNWKELPWFWHGFDWFPFAALMVLLVPGILAFVFGWFAFRRNDMGFGGNNGLTDFKEILGFPIQAASTRIVLFVLSVAALAGGYLLCRWVVSSKFGKVLVAVRDAESRTRFLGYRVEHYKLAVFTLSAMLAGVAGALYVPQVGIINPSEFAPANSIEVVIWVAVGGRGTLAGPILGALLVNAGKTWFTGMLPEFWLFALGGLFVFVTLLMPRGILGAAKDLWAHAGQRLKSRPMSEPVSQAAE
jgi:urea transport system permease protein